MFSFLPNNTLSRAELATDGKVLNIHYGDILIKYTSILNAEYDEIPSIVFGKESKGCSYLQDGDIVIADTAEDETAGKALEIININGRKIESGLHTIPCRPNYSYAPMYLGYYINSAHFHKQLIPLMQGIKVLSVSKSNISKTVISAPKTICEQEKIAFILRLLDCRIKKQQQVIETLKKYKRGVIKSLFERKLTIGCKEAQWKKCYMGDVITLQSGQDFVPSDYNDNGTGIPYMTGASCIVDDKTVVSRWTTKPRCMAYKDDTLLVCKGSGSGAVVKLTQKEVHIARQFMALQCSSAITKDFCFYLTSYLSNRIKQAATGLIEGIDRKTVLNQKILLPSIDEQNKIASFLSNYDSIINAHKAYLACTNDLKKFLLQQLFI